MEYVVEITTSASERVYIQIYNDLREALGDFVEQQHDFWNTYTRLPATEFNVTLRLEVRQESGSDTLELVHDTYTYADFVSDFK